jgi:hypothetical protein
MPNGFPKSIEPIPTEAPPVEIKTMPERFYVKKMKKGKGPKTILIIVMVLIVLGLMAGAAYLFTKSLEKEKPTSAPAATAPTPSASANVPSANVPSANVPPAPVCGNGTCEIGEDSTNCPADCPPPAPSPSPSPTALLPSTLDTDKDGLTDEEEKIYTTDASKPDTDADGYADGLEVVNLYNPIGFAPVKIEDSGLVATYTNQTFNYSIFYPKTWIARALDETNREVLFTSATGEFVQVIVEDNLEHLSALDWYLAKVPEVTAAEVKPVVTKSGLEGVQSQDELTVYFSYGDYIYAITYNIGEKTELNFKSTFEMMYKSFKL